jgi:hypothetical protein
MLLISELRTQAVAKVEMIDDLVARARELWWLEREDEPRE